MATIIDELVVKIGMETSGMKKGSENADKAIKGVKKSSDDAQKSVTGLGGSFTKLFAIVGGFSALKSFTQHVIDSSAQLHRLSVNMDESVRSLDKLGKAATVSGGSVGDMESAINSINKAQNDPTVYGNSPMLKWFAALNIALVDMKGNARQAEDVLDDLNKALSKEPPNRRYYLATEMGFTSGMANLLAKDPQEYQRLKQAQEKNALSAKDAEKAEKVREGTEQLKTDIVSKGTHAVLNPTETFMLNVAKPFFDARNFLGNKIKGGGVQKPASNESSNPQKSALNEVVDFWKSKGLTTQQAQGVAISMQRESSTFNPAERNDQGNAGIAQWDQGRQKKFKELHGFDIWKATRKQQLEYAYWETQNNPLEKKAWEKVKNATSVAGAQREWTLGFERTDNPEREVARGNRLGMAAGFIPPSDSPAYREQGKSVTNINVGGITVNTKATDPQGVGRAVGDEMQDLQRFSYLQDRSSR